MHNNGQIRYTSAFDAPARCASRRPTFATNANTPAAGLSLYRFSRRPRRPAVRGLPRLDPRRVPDLACATTTCRPSRSRVTSARWSSAPPATPRSPPRSTAARTGCTRSVRTGSRATGRGEGDAARVPHLPRHRLPRHRALARQRRSHARRRLRHQALPRGDRLLHLPRRTATTMATRTPADGRSTLRRPSSTSPSTRAERVRPGRRSAHAPNRRAAGHCGRAR